MQGIDPNGMLDHGGLTALLGEGSPWLHPILGQPGGSAEQPSFMPMIFMFVILYLVFYVLLIRPQRKQRIAHEMLLRQLKKNDQVRTSGGIFGKVARVDEGQEQVTLIIDEKQNVKIQVLRSSIVAVNDVSGVVQEPVAATGKRS